MKKRYFALLLALIFFLGMFPAPAYSAEGDAVWESLTLPDGTELEASGEETISLWGIYDITCYTVEVPTVTDAVYLYDDNAYFDGSGVGLATQYTMADGSSYYDSGYPWNITKTGDHFEISMNYDGHNLLDTEPGASASDSGYLLVRVPYSSGATDPAECYFIRFVEKGEARGVDTGEIDPEDYAIWDRIEAYGDDSFDSWAQEDNGIPYYTQDTLEVGGTEYLYYTVYLPENTYDLYLIDEQLYDPEGDSSVFATQLVLGDGKPYGWRDESSADYSGYWDLYNCGAGTISPGSVGFSSIDDPGSLYSGYTGCAFNLFAENPVVMDEEMGSYWNGNEDFYTWPEDNNGYPLLRVAYGPDSSAFDQCYYVRFVQGSLVHPETDVPPVRDGDYYQIYTEEQFQWFRDQVNGGNTGINALLMNSIALSEEWTPIGTAEHPFAGTFNGSGRYVTNLSIDSEADYQGLFGYVSGSVLNIRVTGSVAGGDYVGGVAGYVSATGTLGGGNGCWNLCAVSGTGEHVGGVAGINQGTALSCTNYGAVNGAAETGSGNVSNSKAFFTVNSIAVTGTPKLAYASGETLDVSGLAVTASVTATGANGATFAYQIPLSHLTLSPAAGTALNEQGSVTVTVSYGGKTATFTCNVTDGGKWDGSTMSEPAQAEGVYQIGSAAELAWFANEVNNEERRDIDALLIDDIDLNGKQWTPIGAGYAYNDETGDSSTRYGIIDDTAYMGTFDGGGKTISGLYISTVPEVETADQRKNGNRPLHYETYCQGLFGIIGKEGSVKNLTVDGEVLANATGTFYVNAAHYVGGIAGINMGLIVNCVNEADITGHVYVGGIAGEVGAQTAGQIKVAGRVLNCANYGDVTGTAWSSTNAGGITGQLAYGKLQYVENHGNVSAPYYDPSGFAEYARSVDIGGIAGESVNDPASPTFIDRAWNSGSISAPEGGNRKAGIVGLVQQCTITNVYNTGTVSDCYYYSGGLAGFLYSGSVTNGYSTATVTKYSTSVGNQSGLLVGRASNGTLLKSLYYAASSTKPLHYAESSKPSYTVENVEARTSITASILGGAFIDGVPLPVLDMADAPTGETEIWSVDAIDLENGRITVTLDKKLTSTNLTLDDLLIHAKVNNAATTLTGLSLSQDNSGAATVVTITFDKVMAEAELYVSVVDVSETITTPATDSWLDYRAAAFASGTGAKNDPYIITSAEQLALLAWQVTDQHQDTADKYYKLGDDINLAGRLWTRIGYATMLSENVYTGGKAFNGTFDGDNRDISNLTIQTNQDFFGLFGVISQAGVVKNVNIASGSVTATASNYGGLGAIAGVNYGVIYHCTNAADVSGIRDVGGIAGISGAVNKTITTSLIYRCGNTGAVSGTRDVGGVTSFNAGTVSECYNTGAVEATNVTFGVVGGVVGYHYEGGAFLDSSYNIGSVTGKYAGGVASKVLDNVVRDCYSSGAVSGEGSGGLVGYTVGYYSVRNSYYLASAAPMPYGDNSGTGFEAKGTLEDLAALLGSAFQNGGPAPQLLWQTEDPGDLADETNGLAISALEVKNGYLTITMNKRLMMTQLVQSDFTVTGVIVTGIESRISGGVTVVTLKFNVIPAAAAEQNINISVAYGGGAVNGTLTVEADPSVVPPVYEAAGNWIDNAAAGYVSGNGSVGSPYIINTAEQLAYLANQVNGSEGVNGNSQSGRYFQLGADINLTAKYWTPIGVNMGNCFSGHFDGAGHVVTLNVDDDFEAGGLFGYLDGASVSLLGVEGLVRTGGYAGGIAGYAKESSFENCYSNAYIDGGEYAGGLAGVAQGGCSFVNGFATGLTLGEDSGALFGYFGNGVDVNNLFYRIITGKASEVGVNASTNTSVAIGKTKIYMQSDAFVDDLWLVRTKKGDDGKNIPVDPVFYVGSAYPVLNSDYAALTVQSVEVSAPGTELEIGASHTFSALVYGKNLAAATPVTWTVTGGALPAGSTSTLSVSRGVGMTSLTISIPETMAGGTEITVTAEIGGQSDTVAITANTAPWPGLGTEASPWLISSLADMQVLAQRVNGGSSYHGSYFKLASDVDMADDQVFEPIGFWAGLQSNDDGEWWESADNRPFSGTFDGNGHCLKNALLYAENSYYGLFGYVGRDGAVKNLTIDSCARLTAHNDLRNVGVLAGVNLGTVENCVNRAGMGFTASGVRYLAGIAGLNYGTIDGCVNESDITASAGSKAGIAGMNYGTIIDSENQGVISATGYAGGIVVENRQGGGEAILFIDAYADMSLPGLIQDSRNSAAVTGIYDAGGIAADNYGGRIEGCENTASVTGAISGGIAGRNSGNYSSGGIRHSTNTGNVTATGVYAGGIAGEQLAGMLSFCENHGPVIGADTAGGIAGRNYCYMGPSSVEFSNNYGAVNGANYASGIVGYYQSEDSPTYVRYNYNEGTADYGILGLVVTQNGTGNIYENYYLNTSAAAESSYVSDIAGIRSVTQEELDGYGTDEPSLQVASADLYLNSSTTATSNVALSSSDESVLKVTERTAQQRTMGLLSAGGSTYDVEAVGVGEAYVVAQATPYSYAAQQVRVKVDPAAAGTIQVSFWLIGDEKYGKNYVLTDSSPNTYYTWIDRQDYTVREGSTVGDLFEQALDAANMNYRGLEKGYISTIQGPDGWLAEFSNGKYSGWMYTVDGSHPNVGLNEYVLSDGEAVVWHYVNDYRQEVADWFETSGEYAAIGDGSLYDRWLQADPGDNNNGGGGTNNGDDGTNNGGGGTNNDRTASDTGVFLAPKATASNVAAAVTVSITDMTSAIANAKKKGNAAIVIAPKITGTASKITVELPKASLSSMVAETRAALTVQTPVGNVTLPNETLSSIASQTSGNTVTISLSTVETSSLTADQQAVVGSNPVYDISILSGSTHISSFDGGNITVSLPYTLKSGEDASGVTVWYLNDSGKLQQMTATYDKATGLATFTTTHLSYYVVGYAAVWTNPFSDVKSADWFYGAVKYAVQNGLFNGTLASDFSPNDNMTRAMFVTVLYRLEGEPAVTGTNSFTDVQSGQWYTDAVTWVSTNGIVSGYDGNLFGTNDNITREQMAAMLYRYAQYKGYDVSEMADLKVYTDASDISAWAETAMKWANTEGLITGTTSTALAPVGSATRAQVADTLMRFVENVRK